MIDDTHKHLGELAVMSRQTVEAERKILAEAEKQLAKVEKDLPPAASKSYTGDGQAYMDLLAERGRLQQVIAQARHHLRT